MRKVISRVTIQNSILRDLIFIIPEHEIHSPPEILQSQHLRVQLHLKTLIPHIGTIDISPVKTKGRV